MQRYDDFEILAILCARKYAIFVRFLTYIKHLCAHTTLFKTSFVFKTLSGHIRPPTEGASGAGAQRFRYSEKSVSRMSPLRRKVSWKARAAVMLCGSWPIGAMCST